MIFKTKINFIDPAYTPMINFSRKINFSDQDPLEMILTWTKIIG